MSRLMSGECEVICVECNAYLWSCSTVDAKGETAMTRTCPYVRDPRGYRHG